jgi:hypothetical protein
MLAESSAIGFKYQKQACLAHYTRFDAATASALAAGDGCKHQHRCGAQRTGIIAAPARKTTIASGGTRHRSSSRKPIMAMATSRPSATALT